MNFQNQNVVSGNHLFDSLFFMQKAKKFNKPLSLGVKSKTFYTKKSSDGLKNSNFVITLTGTLD